MVGGPLGEGRDDSAESMLRRPQMEEEVPLVSAALSVDAGTSARLLSSEPRCIAAKPAKGLRWSASVGGPCWDASWKSAAGAEHQAASRQCFRLGVVRRTSKEAGNTCWHLYCGMAETATPWLTPVSDRS